MSEMIQPTIVYITYTPAQQRANEVYYGKNSESIKENMRIRYKEKYSQDEQYKINARLRSKLRYAREKAAKKENELLNILS